MSSCQQCRLLCLAWQLSLQWQHTPEAVPTIAAALGVAAAHAQDRCDAVPKIQGARTPGQRLTAQPARRLRGTPQGWLAPSSRRRCLRMQIKTTSCCLDCTHKAGSGQAWQIKLGTLHLEGRPCQRLRFSHRVGATLTTNLLGHVLLLRQQRLGRPLQGGRSAVWPWRLVRHGQRSASPPCL
jgi:hypothetical protein